MRACPPFPSILLCVLLNPHPFVFVISFTIQIKPDVSTVAFGLAGSQGALLLAGGTKGKRFAMPNSRIMIHQPQGGCGVRCVRYNEFSLKQMNMSEEIAGYLCFPPPVFFGFEMAKKSILAKPPKSHDDPSVCQNNPSNVIMTPLMS